MATPACNYELAELSSNPQVEGVRFHAYLRESDGNLYLTENRDGTGASVRVNKVLDAPANDAHWMVGHRVGVYGIFHHGINSLDVYSIGYINEPGVPRPIPPYPAPSGVSSATDGERTDPAGSPAVGEVMSSTSGDFSYFTHDSEGQRICHEISYAPAGLCRYRLDELASIHEPPVVGVRLYGFLLSRDGSLHIGTNREGTGIILPITQVDDVVPEWLTGRLVETGHLTGLNGGCRASRRRRGRRHRGSRRRRRNHHRFRPRRGVGGNPGEGRTPHRPFLTVRRTESATCTRAAMATPTTRNAVKTRYHRTTVSSPASLKQ